MTAKALARLAIAGVVLIGVGCSQGGEQAGPRGDKSGSTPTTAVSAPPGPPAVPGPDTTAKAADVLSSVPPKSETAKHDDVTGPQTSMSKREEDTAMPKSGQANDHSTPGAGTAGQK